MPKLARTLLCLFLLAGHGLAAARGVEFEQTASKVQDDQLVLGIHARFDLDDNVQEALDNGITLYFEVDTRLLRSRPFWPDQRIAASLHRFALSRHALSARYALVEQGASQARTFENFEDALVALGDIPEALHCGIKLLPPDGSFIARSRLRLVTEELPAPMRPLVWISPSWWISSAWQEWPVTP